MLRLAFRLDSWLLLWLLLLSSGFFLRLRLGLSLSFLSPIDEPVGLVLLERVEDGEPSLKAALVSFLRCCGGVSSS